MRELQPVNQQVLINLDENNNEQTTPGGIIIPDTVKEKPETGTIVSMSQIQDAEISVGEKVLFKRYSGNETEFEGHKYLLIPYSDILAKIVETEEI